MARKYDIPAWRQFHLMRLALRHHETTKADCAVLAEIVQRYHGSYGNAWSSYEMLVDDTGFTRATVKRARRKLERLGFVTILSPGRKSRSTVYLPNFDLIPEKRVTNDPLLNGVKDDPEKDTLGVTPDPESTEYGVKDDPPSYIRLRPTKAERQDIDIDTAPASPPLTDGLEATVAERAIDGFDVLYKAYGYRRGRADARKAYDALQLDADDHADMIESANAWREAWERQNKPDAPRYTLAKWIARECHLEDAPTGYVKPEQKQKQKQGKLIMNAQRDESHRVHKVVGAIIEQENGRTYLTLDTVTEGECFEDISIVLESNRESEQRDGQQDLSNLFKACGVESFEDHNDFVGCSFMRDSDGLIVAP